MYCIAFGASIESSLAIYENASIFTVRQEGCYCEGAFPSLSNCIYALKIGSVLKTRAINPENPHMPTCKFMFVELDQPRESFSPFLVGALKGSFLFATSNGASSDFNKS